MDSKKNECESGWYKESVPGLNMVINKFTAKVSVEAKEQIKNCLKCMDKDKCTEKNGFIRHLDINA